MQCAIRECEGSALARGFCNAHYRRWKRYGDPDGQWGLLALSNRFWTYTTKTDDCWIWNGPLNNKDRPWMSVGGRRKQGSYKLASHIAWYLEYGRWPTLQMNHHCDNPMCVRHNHMYDGTQLQNAQDRVARGTCPAGHPRTPEHMQYRKDGTRYCKTCQNEKRRLRKAEHEH